MNKADWQRVKEVFHDAVEYSGVERDAFVEQACGDDPAVLVEVRGLLASHDADEGLMKSPTFQRGELGEVGATSDAASPGGALLEGPGTMVGRYKLLQEIGSGGFGVVYLAEQTEPVKRKVALKIIKLGMDTKQVIARFEAERQALAMMDHPNIARVLDAGATETGRPFFVMELVRGVPITDYCDKEQLNTQQRLDLFIKVCHAIQHAHQKGIIHRDIKPTNVLVTMHDDVPVPRVIDFGIAKATKAELTERTLFTEHGQMIGTPAYMSPEQAQMSDLDIDTRSDIYSLGVLLYELLTGTTPFSSKELREAGFGEIQRIIQEEEPHKPSTRISSLLAGWQGQAASARDSATSSKPPDGKTSLHMAPAGSESPASESFVPAVTSPTKPKSLATDIAKHRGTDPTSLTRLLRGDLDWIVMKALEKNRTRRYETATGLAMDIRRHLDHEPVLAGPPSASYRLGKLARKHRTLVGGVAALFIVLLCSVVVIGAMYRRAEDARELALESQTLAEYREKEANDARDQLQVVVDFQSSMLSDIDAEKMGRSILDDLRDGIRKVLASRETSPEDIETALATFDNSIAGVNATNLALEMIDEHILTRAVEAIGREFAEQPIIRASLQETVADTFLAVGLDVRAEPLQASALRIFRDELGDTDAITLDAISKMGLVYLKMRRLAEAEPYHQEATQGLRRLKGNDHPDTLGSISNMASVLEGMGKYSEAEPLYREVLEGFRRELGVDHWNTLPALNNMGGVLFNMGRLNEAEAYWREALDSSRRVLGDDHPDTLRSIANMGLVLHVQDRLEEAEVYYREVLERTRRVLGDDHSQTLSSIGNMGTLLDTMGKRAEGEPYLREVLESRRRILGEDHPETFRSMSNMALLLESMGRLEEAEPLFRGALDGRRRVLGDDHPQTLLAINNMGFFHQSAGRPADAEPYYRQALDGYRRVLGEDHPRTLSATTNLGVFLLSLGKVEEAEPYLVEGLDGRRRILGNDHRHTIVSIGSLGRLLRMVGRLTEAESLGAEAIRLCAAKHTPPLHYRFTALLDHGRTLAALGRNTEAEAELLEAYDGLLETRGQDDRRTRDTVQGLIDLYATWGKPEQAAEWRAKLPLADEAEAEGIESQEAESRD